MLDWIRGRLEELSSRVELALAYARGLPGELGAIMGNHAIATSAGGTIAVASPTWAPIAVIHGFAMSHTSASHGKLHVEGVAVFNNPDVAAHTVALGVKVVAHGQPAPSTADYTTGIGDNGINLISGGGPATAALLCDYGGGNGMPAALVPGTNYDVYLMAQADVANHVVFGGNGTNIAIQEQL